MTQLRQSVLEFIQRSEQRPFGLAGEYLLKADDPLQVSDFFNVTYGAKVWDGLNSQRKFFNLIRHVEWGNQIGWRVRSARNAQSRPIGEIDSIPDVGKQTYSSIYSLPRQVVTPIGSSELAQWISSKEGGIGDAMAKELQFGEVDHIKEVHQESMYAAVDIVKTAGATGVGALSTPTAFRIGDELWTNSNSTDGILLTAINNTTGVVSFTKPDGTAASDLVQGETVTVKSREGLTSIDDLIEADGRTMPGTDNQNVDCYNLTTRTAGTYAAAHVIDNDGVPQDFDTDLVDDGIEDVQEWAGDPDLIVLGRDQLKHFKQALQAQRRYMEVGDFVVKRGGEQNLPGQKAGFQVSTYDGVGVFWDIDTPKTIKTDYTQAGSNIYILDTRDLEYGVAFTTEYFEQRDPIIVGKLAIIGLFRTTMELKCYNLRHQCKITDLN